MRRTFLFVIAVVLFVSCTTEKNDVYSGLSFTIRDGDRFASSEINIINTSENYKDGYTWKVSSFLFGKKIYKTPNLKFIANRTGEYLIELRSNTNPLVKISKTITIIAPTKKILNKIVLKKIKKNYSSLYFKIYLLNLKDKNGFSKLVYTSETKNNADLLSPSTVNWEINRSFNLTDRPLGINVYYIVRFYDAKDTSVSSFLLSNLYFTSSNYISGNEDFKSNNSDDCILDCDYFEWETEFTYKK